MKWKFPHQFIGTAAGLLDLSENGIVISQHARHVLTQCAHACTGESCNVEHCIRLEFCTERQSISEDETTFGISVMNLDCLAIAHCENVTQLESASARHVVGAHQECSDTCLYFQSTESTHRGKNCSSATHVHLHRCMAWVAWLQ